MLKIGVFAAVMTSLVIANAHAAQIDLWFAGGQSNATADWAAGIEAALIDSGRYTNPEVVHVNHPGSWLSGWYNHSGEDLRGTHYLTDFYDPSPTAEGAIERRIQELLDAGHTVTIRGMFWMQGEGDTGSASHAQAYGDRLLAMVQLLESDLGIDDLPLVLGLISGNEDYFTTSTLTAERYARIDVVREQLEWVAATQPNSIAVDTAHWTRRDAWHLPFEDYNDMGREFGEAYLAIPEPSSLALLTLGLVLLRRRVRTA